MPGVAKRHSAKKVTGGAKPRRSHAHSQQSGKSGKKSARKSARKSAKHPKK